MFLADFGQFLGNDHIKKLNRKMAVKDIIDLILFHTKYLKSLPNNRQELYEQKYGLKKNYQTLFFFDLKDSIFLTSSADTDYYKKIKFNNVLIYMIFIFIIEINHGYMLTLKESKMCNYYIFEKLIESLFSGLFLRISKKEKIRIIKIPLLCYVIYYFSFILTSYRLWLWNSVEKGFNASIQRQIIVTVIELLNSLAESNIDSEKNYMNMRFYSRFKNNLDSVYKDNNLLERIKERSNSRIKIKDKKVIYTVNKVDTISLDGIFKNRLMHRNQKEVCQSKTYLLKTTKKNKVNNEISSLTHCSDGRFHKWEITDKELVCSLCKKRYNSLKNNDTSSDNDTRDILNNIKWNMVRKLVKKYCISGEKHDIDKKTGKCKLCKINPETYQFKIKDLKELDKNLTKLKMEQDLNNIKNMNKIFKKKEKYQQKVSSLLLKLNNKFEKETKDGKFDSKFVNYLDKFIDKLEIVVGKRISDQDNIIYLKDNVFIIDHDYLGNSIKNPINVLSTNKKIKKEINHKFFKMDVLYYQDKSKSVYVYYNSVSLHYLGYSQDNKKFIKLRTKASLKINYSFLSMFSLLGLSNKYVNLADIDNKYLDLNVKPTKKELQHITKYILMKE